MDGAQRTPSSWRSTERARALALSCHPLPSFAVTAMAAGLVALTPVGLGRGLLLVGAVLSGQLSIGWSNDWIDAARDRATHRTDKPAALGAVPVSTVATAAWAALLGSVLCAVWLGDRAGAASLVIVVCGWAYNLGLKAVVWSWLPYAVAFGALPATATLASPGSPWPTWWAMAAGATLGVSAHLANVLPDLADDAATGVRGLPHRLGQRGTAIAGPALLVSATALIVFGPGRRVDGAGWLAVTASLAVGLVAGVGAASPPGQRPGRRYFLATVAIAVLDLVLFGVAGGRLSR